MLRVMRRAVFCTRRVASVATHAVVDKAALAAAAVGDEELVHRRVAVPQPLQPAAAAHANAHPREAGMLATRSAHACARAGGRAGDVSVLGATIALQNDQCRVGSGRRRERTDVTSSGG